jgi:hypothetical protein
MSAALLAIISCSIGELPRVCATFDQQLFDS